MSEIDPELQMIVEEAFPALSDLFAAGEEVATMLETSGWRALRHALGAELRAEEARLGRGRKPLDQAEYALAHGRLGALQTALKLPAAIVQRAEEIRQEQSAKHESAEADAPAGR